MAVVPVVVGGCVVVVLLLRVLSCVGNQVVVEPFSVGCWECWLLVVGVLSVGTSVLLVCWLLVVGLSIAVESGWLLVLHNRDTGHQERCNNCGTTAVFLLVEPRWCR